MSALFSATALIVPFENLRMTDVEVVVGKNASLGEMISQLPQGVRVPTGFATTAHAFREFLAFGGLAEKINARLKSLDTDDVRALAVAGAEIRGWVEAQPFPADLEKAIREAFATLSAGNAQAGAITVITSSITGVDTVTNAAAFLNGADAEPDAAFRKRFVLFLASLSKGTKAAIGSAVLGVQQGLNYTITENETYGGNVDMGYLYVVVDDGTGHASSDLLNAVGSAIDAVRPFTGTFGVFAPVIVTANVTMTAVLFTYMCMQPLFGALSDRIGRKWSMMLFGGLATLCTVPLLTAIGSVESPLSAYFLVVAALAIVSFYTSISGLVKAEMFPAEVRALGVGLSYAIANALFGGSAEAVALAFKDAGHETWFFWYVTAMCAIAFLTALTMLANRPTYLAGEGTE